MSDIEYNPFGNSISSFHVGADILNLLYLYVFFMFFHVYYDLARQYFFHLLLNLVYQEAQVFKHEDLIFKHDFIKLVSVFCTCIDLIMLLYTFLVTSFD